MMAPLWLILAVSASTDFLISAGGVLTGAMVANGTIGMPTKAVWLFAVIVGLVAVGKELRSQLKLPPIDVSASANVKIVSAPVKIGALVLALLLAPAVASAAPPCGQSGELSPVGFQQLTISTTSTALTVPTNAIYAVVIVATNAINVRDDGTAPTASVGMPYGVSSLPQTFTICGTAALSGTKMIRRAADSEVDVSYYK